MTQQKQQQQNYFGPFVTMVLLFFIVGFITSVNGQFQAPLKEAFGKDAAAIKNTLATLISFSWFLAYPCTGWIGAKWVNRYGYKGTLVRGLSVLALGLLLFVCSAWGHGVLGSFTIGAHSIPWAFPVFLLGSFVAGGAVTTLQVVINPYLIASEVKGTTEATRINIGGTLNSIGTTIAPFFVTGMVFGGVSADLVQVKDVIVPFIIFSAFVALIMFIVSKLRLPDIQGTVAEKGEELTESIWSFRHLTLGVLGIFFYVGAECAIGNNIKLYADTLPDYATSGVLMATLYWGGMLVGRICGSFLKFASAKAQLIGTTLIAAVLIIVAIATKNPWFLVAVGLVHSVMWGMIFSLAITGLGKYTSKGSGALMIGVIGGGLIPLLQGVMADSMGGIWLNTWWLVVVCELYMLFYAIAGSKPNKTAV